MMALDEFVKLYLSYVNDFITIERFAEYYNLTLDKANFIVSTGRSISYFNEGKINENTI